MKILLVEDEDLDACVVQRVVKRNTRVLRNANLIRVRNLTESLELLAVEDFVLVLLDLGLPDSEGIHGVETIVRKHPNTPVIVLTGNDTDEIGIEAVAAGAQDFVTKSGLTTKELERVIEFALERERFSMQISKANLDIRRAREADEAKSQFLANMSHEIRTPLHAILGFANLISEDSSIVGTNRNHIDAVCRAGHHLLNLINDVLEMSKIEAGSITLNRKPFELHELLKSIQEIFHVTASKKGIDFTIKIAKELPKVVSGDEGKLRQILVNLVGNGIKFSPNGSVALQAEVTGTTDNGWKVHFSVRDTGPGIAKNEQARIFKPFERIEEIGVGAGGTGLGLPLSQRFASAMDSKITLESELGQGSVFGFELELEKTSDTLADIPDVEEATEIPESPKRVLVVDDDSLNRRILVSLLEPRGYLIREAEDGSEGLHVFRDWSPDIVLVDRRMPRMDGLQLTREIKALSDALVILVTACAFEEDKQEALDAGADAFLRKPLPQETLFKTLAELEANPAVEVETKQTENVINDVDWKERVCEAAKACNHTELIALTEELSQTHPEFGKNLSELVTNFQYTEVVSLMNKAA